MDYKTSALIPALYLVLAVAVVGVACVGFVIYRPEPSQRVTEQLASNQSRTDDPRLSQPASSATNSSQVEESYAKAVQRNLQLEQLLDKRTQLLERKSALLDKREAEYRELKRELDEYVMLLSQINPTPTEDAPPPETVAEPAPSEEESAAQAQLEQLRVTLSATKAAERQLESELTQVKEKLADAYAEMAEQELASLVVQDNAVADASARIVARMGAEAIPAIVELLSDRRAEVRAWAAAVLGRMGRLAVDTVPQLREALMDPDPRVRRAAERSIDRILD